MITTDNSTCRSLGSTSASFYSSSKSSLVAFGCFARCICNRSTLAKISGLSMLSSMSAVVLRPSGRVTVISPSLTSCSRRVAVRRICRSSMVLAIAGQASLARTLDPLTAVQIYSPVSFLLSKLSSISTLLGSRRKICQRALFGTWFTWCGTPFSDRWRLVETS